MILTGICPPFDAANPDRQIKGACERCGATIGLRNDSEHWLAEAKRKGFGAEYVCIACAKSMTRMNNDLAHSPAAARLVNGGSWEEADRTSRQPRDGEAQSL